MNFVEQAVRRDVSGSASGSGLGRQLRRGRKWPIHYEWVEQLAIVSDLVTIVSISVFCGVVQHLREFGTAGDIGKSLGTAVLVSALFIASMKIRGMYRPTKLLALRNQVTTVCVIWASVWLLLTGTAVALKITGEFSRSTSSLFAALGLAALIVDRNILKALVARALATGRFSGRNIILITDHSQTGTSLFYKLAGLGFRIERHFIFPPLGADDRRRERLVAKVIEHIRGSEIQEVVVGADPARWSELRILVAGLKAQPFPVSFVPLGMASEIFSRPRRELGDSILVGLQRAPLTPLEHVAKRSIDVVFAGMALLTLLPLFLIVAIAIKLDSPGPVLFRQQRCGFNGRNFRIFKFRTMSVLEDGASVTQAQIADKRVTPLGTWLRKTSIDELPQLLNVLDGSMSLVGPRPHALVHDHEFDKKVRNYAFRRRVKPGLTGWAQVNGCRGPTPTNAVIARRVDYDLWYIDNWSIGLDLTILLRTPIELLRANNAY